MARIRKSEESLQISLSTYIKCQYPDVIFTAESSGIRVGINAAKKMKSQRSTGKHLDLIISEPRAEWHGLFLELKTFDKSPYLSNGSLSSDKHIQEQHKMITRLYKKGYYACFAVGFDEARKIIDWYMSKPAFQGIGNQRSNAEHNL